MSLPRERAQKEPLVADRQGRIELAIVAESVRAVRDTPRSAFRRVKPRRPVRNAVFAHCVTMLIAPSTDSV